MTATTASESPKLGPAAAAPTSKPFFHAPRSDWKEALMFMLSMAAFGLEFYPAMLLAVIIMVRSFRRDRYQFMVQLLLFCGHFALVRMDIFPIKRSDLLLIAGFVGLFVIRKKDPMIRRTTIAFVVFIVCIVALSLFSVEEFSVQFRMMREEFSIVVFTVPLLIFAGREFKAGRFFQLIGVYSVILCVFYAIDGFIIRGWLLVPASPCPYGTSTFYNLIVNPLNITYFPRKYPQGIVFLSLLIYPLLHYYKFNRWQWASVGLAFLAMRTLTILAGFVITYLCFIGRGRKVVMAFLATLIAFVGLYFVDLASGGFMRIASTVEQFALLKVAEDRDDLAEFGSSRMAQIIPKMELLYEQHREWIGFGFLHPDLTKKTSLQLFNDLYSDIEKANENPAAVEETHITAILQIGYIGLILQTAFYIVLYFIIRRCRLSSYYLTALIFSSIAGIGGFAGLNHSIGLFCPAWAFAVALLDHWHRPHREDESSEAVEAPKSDDHKTIKFIGPLRPQKQS